MPVCSTIWRPGSLIYKTAVYLTKMHVFQKHNATAAYKIAGGVDTTAVFSAKATKQKAIGPEFASKISKAFLDALYAFLDGLVHLESDDWHLPNTSLAGIEGVRDAGSTVGINVVVGAPALDLSSTVRLNELIASASQW